MVSLESIILYVNLGLLFPIKVSNGMNSFNSKFPFNFSQHNETTVNGSQPA